MQVRAQVTQQRIIDAAVGLFDEVGFGSVDLSDILERAQVTKGAFYYHFPTKESVASAIIDTAEAEFTDTVIGILTSSPALENLIRSTFAMASLHERDPLNRVADQLRQALTQVSGAGAATYRQRRKVVFGVLADAVTRGIADGDLVDDIDADQVAHTLWAFTLGNRVLADAIGEDIFAGLTDAWQLLLRGIATPEAAGYFEQFVVRMSHQHTCRYQAAQR
jgi:AcrR family transcriptional regulator